MIDQNVFRREWAILCERYGRQPSPELTARYYQILTARMDTDQFVEGAAAVMDRCEFFPRPADFTEAVLPDPATAAWDQWELCERVMHGETHVLERMSPEGRRVVQIMGGARALGQTPVDAVAFRRKEFLGAYADMTSARLGGRILEGAEVTPESRRIVGEAMREPGPRLVTGGGS